MTNPAVNWFFEKESKWQSAYRELREIALESGLTEELKWGCPCYTNGNDNVFLIHGFKDYCALLFMQGALLKDTKKLLVQQTKNVQAARQMRFTSEAQVISLKASIKSYIKEAAKNSKAGLKVQMKETAAFDMPKEFNDAMTQMPELKKAFYKLTPGRQRGYLLYFGSAKQSKTRMDRVEKYIPKILDNKGLED